MKINYIYNAFPRVFFSNRIGEATLVLERKFVNKNPHNNYNELQLVCAHSLLLFQSVNIESLSIFHSFCDRDDK